MALPTRADILANGYFFAGAPFVAVDAKSSVDSENNGYFFAGSPFSAANSSSVIVIDVIVNLTGEASTGAIGNVDYTGSATVILFGLTGITGIGSISPEGSALVSLNGVSGIGRIGLVPFWIPIDDSQPNNWIDIK